MNPLPTLLFLLTAIAALQSSLLAKTTQFRDEVDPQVFEFAPFVVYEGAIDIVDGFSGETYHEGNEVVALFGEDFNKLLLRYHRKLLHKEYLHMKERLEYGKATEADLAALAQSFGIDGFAINQDRFLTIERSIFRRLVQDPFFKIDSLIVWDLDRLDRRTDRRPDSKYAKNIRYNQDTGKWARRVTTKWKVSFWRNQNNRIDVLKEQGLNLDTNAGFHFIDRGLTPAVPSNAFEDVILNYPIFVNDKEPVEVQVERLKETFINNLYHIYDPFSWAWRRNLRFRGGFVNEMTRHVQSANFRLKDRDWFNPVMGNFLNDIVTLKHQGPDEIYDLSMLQKVAVNRNILGSDLDLLNWNKGENRQVKYDPKNQPAIWINFNNPAGARFIMLDAYRRYKDRFVEILRYKLTNIEKKVSAKDLIKEALAEASGIPANIYIKKATQAQIAELEKHRYAL